MVYRSKGFLKSAYLMFADKIVGVMQNHFQELVD